MPTLEEQLQTLATQLTDTTPATLPAMPRQSADDGGGGGWTGLLGDVGEVLSGGQSPTYRLRGSERAAAGSRALLNFGINMMMASGPQRYRPDLFTGFASGLQGAQQSMDLDQQRAAAAARENYTQRMELAKLGVEQSKDKIERAKAALTLLQMQQRSTPLPGDPNVYGGGPGGSGGGSYETAVAGIEGTGKDPRSSAVSGFIDSTWQSFVQANPDQFKGMTPEQVMAARNDPKMVAKATNWYAQQNVAALKDAGITPSGQTLGLAHRLGPGAATKVLQAPDGDVVAKYLSPEAVKANPAFSTMTVGDLKRQYAGVPNPSFLGTTTATSGATTPPPYKVATTGAVPPPPSQAPPAPEPLPLDAAKVQADKTGQSVPVAGSPGLFAHPGGNVGPARPAATSTATTTAAATVPQQPEPKPGSVEAYVKEHAAYLVPDDATRASWSTSLTPEQEANIRLQKQQAQTALAAQYAKDRRGDKDVDIQGAQLKLVEAETAENTLRENARKQGQEAEAKWKAERLKELTAAHAAEQAAITGETKAQADHRRALELQEAQQEGQFVTDQKKKFGDSQQGAYDQLDSLQTLRQLSDAIPGQATLTPGVRDFLVRFGFTPDGLTSESARVQAFESALSRTVVELRKGVQMGQLSDRDLSFIQNMGPQAMQNPETRAAIIGHLITAANRKAQYIERVNELYGGGKAAGGMSWSDAVRQARKDVPEFVVPTIPDELMPGYRPKGRDPSIPGPVVDNTQARRAWIKDHVPRGGLVRLPDGTMRPVSLGD